MHGETPEFKRCCFCFPLRRGLMGWGYLRLALDLLAIFQMIFAPVYYLEHLIVVSIFLLDAVFSLLLIVAGYKKNPKLLRISNIYSIVWLIAFLILGGFHVYWEIRRLIRLWYSYHYSPYIMFGILVGIAFIFSIFVLQVYVILMTRSEEIKLRKQNLEMQFVNNAADAESRCVLTATDNGHDRTVQ